MNNIQDMTISQIAGLIISDYRGRNKAVPVYAQPYVSAMRSLESVNDNYGLDDGRSIVAYALSNLATWKGEVAKAVKAELRNRIR